MESTRFALQDIALTTNFLVNRHMTERAHFVPAWEDSGTALDKEHPHPGIRIWHANNGVKIRKA